REVHVRFWERAEVKFLRATRQPPTSPSGRLCQLRPAADMPPGETMRRKYNDRKSLKLGFDVRRGPHAPQAGPREDDGKPSYPRLARRSPRGVAGCLHRSSQIQPHQLAREQASAEADCANRLRLRVRSRCCTKKLESYP